MRLRVNPLVFIVKLAGFLVLTYLVWGWVEPFYLRLLTAATRAGVWLSEISFDPTWRWGTTILTKGTGIFYYHRHFAAFSPPLEPQGIPGDWIMANVVLLTALMFATPAPTWRARAGRVGLAFVLVLILQVIDIVVAIKVAYAGLFYGYWSPAARKFYQFLDAFFQSFDTQLFPFAIWAGIHFRELVAWRVSRVDREPSSAEGARPAESRATRRRASRGRSPARGRRGR